ncbi:MAG: triose-phosphate isomerase [Ignavibacteriae bacterium]|nr:triose-phosphate isomerase [Ignavibacteriota bacterium]MCB0750063.1 triose-phosphate isomerase [Ignavibacteriota bacterium]MCB9249022.1 triose-phosphate isomerase [Ignavibacteriales bacterium]
MRKYIIAGNWKMQKNLSEAIQLVSDLKNELEGKDIIAEVVIAPPFMALEAVKSLIKNSVIKLSAQNMHSADSGAFTGEVSADMLKSVGCEYVILGHSERRTIFGETDEFINSKIKQALKNNLIPIVCCGESLDERENGTTFNIIESQIKAAFNGLTNEQAEKLVIAYEPIWAIGTGKTASPEQAQEVHAFIRKIIAGLTTQEIANGLTIQYGGSVKPDNAKELLSKPDIDGALVGGACLKADSFRDIILSV